MLDGMETDVFLSRDYLGKAEVENQDAQEPEINKDGAMYFATSHISENYVQLMRRHVLPSLTLNPGLKLREIRVLGCMLKYKFPLQASDVARLLCVDPSTISRAVQKLLSENMIHKLECRDDARAHILVLTEPGRDVAAEYNQKAYKICKYLSGLTELQLSTEDVKEFLRIAELIKIYSSELASFRPSLTKDIFA